MAVPKGFIPFELSPDLLLGSATAAVQIEGGDRNNSWYRWAEQGRIKDGSSPYRATDHWNRVEEDSDLLQELSQETYRLGVEWSRIEPSEGVFDQQAISHYREELSGLIRRGIRPLVTLHHFSNPLWFEDSGGWLAADAPRRFRRYVNHVVRALGDLVAEWVTINEPNVYLYFGYVEGTWPPGRRSVFAYLRGLKQMTRAHRQAYDAIHKYYRNRNLTPRVGIALHLRVYDPVKPTPGARFAAWVYRNLGQDIFFRRMIRGHSDFLGINYYSRDMIRFSWNPALLFGRLEVKQGAPTNDLGWEIYPEGLYRVCESYYSRCRLPIFITENGTCDAADRFRARYVVDHLRQVNYLISSGVPVERYYHWTLVDNFEWMEGESARFGLVACDFKTGTRTIRESGRLYAEICRKKSVTRDLAERFLNG